MPNNNKPNNNNDTNPKLTQSQLERKHDAVPLTLKGEASLEIHYSEWIGGNYKLHTGNIENLGFNEDPSIRNFRSTDDGSTYLNFTNYPKLEKGNKVFLSKVFRSNSGKLFKGYVEILLIFITNETVLKILTRSKPTSPHRTEIDDLNTKANAEKRAIVNTEKEKEEEKKAAAPQQNRNTIKLNFKFTESSKIQNNNAILNSPLFKDYNYAYYSRGYNGADMFLLVRKRMNEYQTSKKTEFEKQSQTKNIFNVGKVSINTTFQYDVYGTTDEILLNSGGSQIIQEIKNGINRLKNNEEYKNRYLNIYIKSYGMASKVPTNYNGGNDKLAYNRALYAAGRFKAILEKEFAGKTRIKEIVIPYPVPFPKNSIPELKNDSNVVGNKWTDGLKYDPELAKEEKNYINYQRINIQVFVGFLIYEKDRSSHIYFLRNNNSF